MSEVLVVSLTPSRQTLLLSPPLQILALGPWLVLASMNSTPCMVYQDVFFNWAYTKIPCFLFNGHQGLFFLGVKWAGPQADRSLPANAEANNVEAIPPIPTQTS
jgi:hypothetical protein